MSVLRTNCSCDGAAVLVRRGTLCCASCGAPATAAEASLEYTTHRLPPDVPHRDAFHRACASGRVVGAKKRGRVWSCTAEAWAIRAPAATPRAFAGKRRKPSPFVAIDVGEDVLRELGGRIAS